MGKAVFESDQQEEEKLDYKIYRNGDYVEAVSDSWGPVVIRQLLPKKVMAKVSWNNHLLVPLNPSVAVEVDPNQQDVGDAYVRVINQGATQIYSIQHFRLTENDETRV